MRITIFQCHLLFELIGENELIYWQDSRDPDDGLHCFTEPKWFMPPLLPVLIENSIALGSQTLAGEMKDTVAVYKVKGGPCIHMTHMYKAPSRARHCHRHWVTAQVCFLVFPGKRTNA